MLESDMSPNDNINKVERLISENGLDYNES